MDGFELEVLDRLPLAEASLTVFKYVLSDSVLSEVFDNNRGRAYHGILKFSTLVDLILNALLVHSGSGRESFIDGQDSGILDVSVQAGYGKLRRLPVPVSESLLSVASIRTAEIIPPTNVRVLSPCFDVFEEVVIIDGKKLKALAKRLKPLRGVTGSLLGGKVLVEIDGRTGLVKAMASALDGEANDAPLVPALATQIRNRKACLRIWVADRQFCDLTIPHLLSKDGDAFVIRHCLKMNFYPDPLRPARESRDSDGRKLQEEWGWVGSVKDKRRLYVRRVTLFRTTGEAIFVLTNLLDSDEFPAAAVMQLYGDRWEIERVFQIVTEVFQLQKLIGSSPQAAIFQAALCFILYNMIQVIRSHVAESQRIAAETISSEMLFRDVHKQMICFRQFIKSLMPDRVMELPDDPDLVFHRIKTLLQNVWSDRWKKSPPKKNWQPTEKTKKVAGGHSSAWKLLNIARNPPPPKPSKSG